MCPCLSLAGKNSSPGRGCRAGKRCPGAHLGPHRRITTPPRPLPCSDSCLKARWAPGPRRGCTHLLRKEDAVLLALRCSHANTHNPQGQERGHLRARTPRRAQGTQPWPGLRWPQERGSPAPGTCPAKGTRPRDLHALAHGPHRLTAKSQPRPCAADFRLPRRPSRAARPQALPRARATRRLEPAGLAKRDDRRQTRPQTEAEGCPFLPNNLPAPAALTHPIPALGHLVEGGDTPRQGRANKGLSHRSLEATAAPAGNQRLCDGAPLLGPVIRGACPPQAGPSSLRGFSAATRSLQAPPSRLAVGRQTWLQLASEVLAHPAPAPVPHPLSPHSASDTSSLTTPNPCIPPPPLHSARRQLQLAAHRVRGDGTLGHVHRWALCQVHRSLSRHPHQCRAGLPLGLAVDSTALDPQPEGQGGA